MTTTQHHYTLELLRMDVRHWVKLELISVHQPIYSLAKLIPMREWPEVEKELELHEYLLRDRIRDLIPDERWEND